MRPNPSEGSAGARKALGCLAVGMLFFFVPFAYAADSPRQSIRHLNAVLVETMRNARALGFKGRYERLAPVLRRTFHFPEMARVAVGGHWKKLSDDQRKRLVDTFTRMSITTFAARFAGYSGERFEVLGERPSLRGSVVVENRVVKASGEIVPINYLLRKFGNVWRIVDVYLEAKYSEMALRRSQYGSVIRRQGFDALLRKLDERITAFRAGAGA